MALSHEEALRQVDVLPWYHSVDLGNGVVTKGQYDHRPYLPYYGLPDDLRGKTALDIGAASGFFSFELERRGASVTATELPQWFDHDFGPVYQADQTAESGNSYLHQPFDVAKQLRGSNVDMKWINIYDISPETVGVFDIVFCGSVLIHLTDPIKALWNIAQVTREKAIIATVIHKQDPEQPIATMVGHASGYCWWEPTRACLELMAVAAGFVGIEWVSDFQLNYRDQSVGPHHGVLHAYPTTEGWTKRTRHRDQVLEASSGKVTNQAMDTLVARTKQQEKEISRLRSLVAGYERGRVMRLMRFTQTKVRRLLSR